MLLINLLVDRRNSSFTSVSIASSEYYNIINKYVYTVHNLVAEKCQDMNVNKLRHVTFHLVISVMRDITDLQEV